MQSQQDVWAARAAAADLIEADEEGLNVLIGFENAMAAGATVIHEQYPR